jgi:hypothetical protein
MSLCRALQQLNRLPQRLPQPTRLPRIEESKPSFSRVAVDLRKICSPSMIDQSRLRFMRQQYLSSPQLGTNQIQASLSS